MKMVAVAGALVVLTACGGGSSPSSSPTASPGDKLPSYVVAKTDVGQQPCAVEGGFGSIWVSVYGDDTVSRIDGHILKVRTVKVDGSPVGVAPVGGAVWVTSKTANTIDRIDPATLKVTRTKVGLAPTWTSWGEGRLWIAVVTR